MDFPKISCIYCIECKVNDKKYIGQSSNLSERFKLHKYSLKNNRHKNILLQKDFSLYGIENFNFYIVEYCKKENLNNSEKYWIKYYDTYYKNNKGYNLDFGGNEKEKTQINDEDFMKNEKIQIDYFLSSFNNILLNKLESNQLRQRLNNFTIIKMNSRNRLVGINKINNILAFINSEFKIISKEHRIGNNKRKSFWEVINCRNSQND